MKKILPLFLLIFISSLLYAQDFTGQWKGAFTDKSTSYAGWGGDKCEYVLELECSGTKVSGYSYTYFSDGGKRYYTICKLSGTINKASKSIEVKEIKRTKTNVPVTIRNCFQIHRLSYFKKGDDQTLEGSWAPAPNQEGDCGFGTTLLSRRVLQKNPAYMNNTVAKPKPATTAPTVKNIPKETAQPVVKVQTPATNRPVIKKDKKTSNQPPVVNAVPEKKANTPAKEPITNNLPTPPPVVNTELVKVTAAGELYKKRVSELLKTIEIDNPSFTVNLYDNGEVDGDSISLFFNGKLIISHKRLSEKPLSLKLEIDTDRELNELVMYAENLGTIAPNTALMVVNDGDNRYEVRISSDLQKSGVIRFKHKHQ